MIRRKLLRLLKRLQKLENKRNEKLWKQNRAYGNHQSN